MGIRSANNDPFKNAATGRCQSRTNPLITSTASAVASEKAITWQASISRRRSMRSMSAPPKGATTRNGNPAEKVTMPTNPGELVMTMANQPSATCCIHCPTEDASAASHRLRNTGCRATAPMKRACQASSTGLPRNASSNRARGLTRRRSRHDFLQGNACPSIAASARAGNRRGLYHRVSSPIGSAEGWSILRHVGRSAMGLHRFGRHGKEPSTWIAS